MPIKCQNAQKQANMSTHNCTIRMCNRMQNAKIQQCKKNCITNLPIAKAKKTVTTQGKKKTTPKNCIKNEKANISTKHWRKSVPPGL